MFFKSSPTLPEVLVVYPEIIEDNRGFFFELYRKDKFEKAGIKISFVQDNRSRSIKGTLRGLHYQLGRPQGKLVWVLEGIIFDVAVDIRRTATTFGKWTGHILSDENNKGIYVPPDFAHGFCVLSDEAEILYKCSDLYSPEHERCIRWDDPDLAIHWPIQDPILSEKDGYSPFLKDAELP